jgi:hypothetical protein
VLEEELVAGAEVVEAGFPVRGLKKAVAGALKFDPGETIFLSGTFSLFTF